MATDIIITATFDVDPEKIDDLMKRCKPLIDGAWPKKAVKIIVGH